MANLKQIACEDSNNNFSAAHLLSPYTDIGFSGDSSVHSVCPSPIPYPLFVFGYNTIWLSVIESNIVSICV